MPAIRGLSLAGRRPDEGGRGRTDGRAGEHHAHEGQKGENENRAKKLDLVRGHRRGTTRSLLSLASAFTFWAAEKESLNSRIGGFGAGGEKREGKGVKGTS
jgi:hypothetical protein